jgi:hypothetical protein
VVVLISGTCSTNEKMVMLLMKCLHLDTDYDTAEPTTSSASTYGKSTADKGYLSGT